MAEMLRCMDTSDYVSNQAPISTRVASMQMQREELLVSASLEVI